MRYRWPIVLIAVALLVGACASPSASGTPAKSSPPEESEAAEESQPAGESEAAEASAPPAEGVMTSVFDLNPGDCFNEAAETVVNEVEVIDCDAAHDYEIYGVSDYPAGGSEAYVGDDEIQSFVETECLALFEPFVGETYDDSDFFIYYLAPTEDSWGDGDREVLCALYEPDVQLEGSMEGSAR